MHTHVCIVHVYQKYYVQANIEYISVSNTTLLLQVAVHIFK